MHGVVRVHAPVSWWGGPPGRPGGSPGRAEHSPARETLTAPKPLRVSPRCRRRQGGPEGTHWGEPEVIPGHMIRITITHEIAQCANDSSPAAPRCRMRGAGRATLWGCKGKCAAECGPPHPQKEIHNPTQKATSKRGNPQLQLQKPCQSVRVHIPNSKSHVKT